MHLLGLGTTVELANKPRAVPHSPFSEVGNEGLDQVPAGLTEFLGPIEINGVAFNCFGVQLMLSNQQAKSVTKTWLGIA
jgi:hypothetical protein